MLQKPNWQQERPVDRGTSRASRQPGGCGCTIALCTSPTLYFVSCVWIDEQCKPLSLYRTGPPSCPRFCRHRKRTDAAISIPTDVAKWVLLHVPLVEGACPCCGRESRGTAALCSLACSHAITRNENAAGQQRMGNVFGLRWAALKAKVWPWPSGNGSPTAAQPPTSMPWIMTKRRKANKDEHDAVHSAVCGDHDACHTSRWGCRNVPPHRRPQRSS